MMQTPFRAAIACLVLVGLWGCGNAYPSASRSTEHVHLSWAGAANTVAGLAANSDAVAQIRVQSVAGTGLDKDVGGGVPFTLFTASVDEWLMGNGGPHITIKQSGDKTVQVEGDPLLRVGESAVVFLHRIADGRYFIVGGPTGRLHLDGRGNLVPMPHGILNYTGPVSGLVAALRG